MVENTVLIMPAFVPTVGLPSTRRVPSRLAPWVCSREAAHDHESQSVPPQQRTYATPKRPLPAVIVGAVASAIALTVGQFAPVPQVYAASKTAPPAPAKELRYDGRQELDSGEKAMSLTLTAGTFAVLAVWAWKQNRKDDELENIRIKKEVERLEKLKAEFMDVEEDEETMDDEDLLASLKQRIGDTEDTDEDGKESPEAGTERVEGQQEGEAIEGQPSEGATDVATSDSLDMLKRMWDATDGDDDPKKDKS